jgi:hypothetical protein
MIFGNALFAGRIGTPISHDSIASPTDSEWRASTRGWLGAILTGAIRNQQAGPVIQSFIQVFEIPIAETMTAAPSKALLFIRGDLEE